ncbi:hypothetical protein P8775_13475 [Enterobacter cloacae]
MNLFTLSENGASEFTFVVSRASVKKMRVCMMWQLVWCVS